MSKIVRPLQFVEPLQFSICSDCFLSHLCGGEQNGETK
ncbi:hypothetical protein BSPWISOX_1645 [uncultured Gammaproteobacteria bacterium]|nr:hypothetical protein BSPWISOX_1645 [uncultured Gammaproteobacteria bacterium]